MTCRQTLGALLVTALAGAGCSSGGASTQLDAGAAGDGSGPRTDATSHAGDGAVRKDASGRDATKRPDGKADRVPDGGGDGEAAHPPGKDAAPPPLDASRGSDAAKDQGSPAPEDLFDTLAARYAAVPRYAVVSRPASGSALQYSAAYVPSETTTLDFHHDPRQNPILDSLLTMIEHTPKGANIRMAHFQLDLPDVATALVQAIQRGVGVRLVKAGSGEEDGGASHASEIKAAIRALPASDPNASFDEVLFCEHRTTPTDDGACIGEHLMHNKFTVFSKVCALGLTASNGCVDDKAYRELTAQQSLNWETHNLYNFNTLTVFGGRDDGDADAGGGGDAAAPGYPELYSTYLTYFDDLLHYGAQPHPPASFEDLTTLSAPGNDTSKLMGYPSLVTSGTPYDQMATDLATTRCATGATKTRIKVTTNLWTYSDDPSRRDYRLMQAVKGRFAAGCELIIAGASSMNRELLDAGARAASETLEAEHVLYGLPLDFDHFRFFKAHDPVPAWVTLHAKLIIVEQPTSEESRLLFGSLTMENPTVVNDNVWLSIGHPDGTTLAFYEKVFDSVFDGLTGHPQ